MNQTTFFGFVEFPDFKNTQYYQSDATYVMSKFTVSLEQNITNIVTLEFDPQQNLTIASPKIYFNFTLQNYL